MNDRLLLSGLLQGAAEDVTLTANDHQRNGEPDTGLAAAVEEPANLSESVNQRVTDLARQALSYLKRPTNANYKHAISLYERILGFNELQGARRTTFQEQLETTRRDYELFRSRFGELITARQLQRDEIELIELRKLINAGIELGPNGEELEPQFETLLIAVREKQMRIAREQADQAGKQAADGLTYLDVASLDAALERYAQAIRLLQGTEIQGVDDSPAADIAIRGIRNLLQNETAELTINDYEQRTVALRDVYAAVQRIRPLYDEAETAFRQGNYAQAVTVLESVAGLAGAQVTSPLIAVLQRRSLERWEQAAQIQAEGLMQAARSAAIRGDDAQVERCISDLLRLEPHLPSEALHTYKHQGQDLIRSVQQAKQQCDQLIGAAGLARANGAMVEAERLAREALTLRPGYRPAQQALDTALSAMLHAAVGDAERALAAPTAASLQTCRDTLVQHRRHVEELSKPAVRKKRSEQLEGALAAVRQAMTTLAEASEQARRAGSLVEAARGHLQQQRYAEALSDTIAARALTPDDLQIHQQETDIRTAWAGYLQEQARMCMQMAHPDPIAAVEYLETLREIGMEDVASTSLRRQAERLVHKEHGLLQLARGDFAGAIKTLRQADPDDLAVQDGLDEAHYREAERLMELGDWDAALDILRQIDTVGPEVLALANRARAEQLLEQARSHLEVKAFDQAETCLQAAEQTMPNEGSPQFEQLRGQIVAGRAAFHQAQALIQQAQTALNEDRYALARTLASQAGAQDPSLLDEASRLAQASTAAEVEHARFMRQVITLVLLVALLVGGAVLGPWMWGWIP